MDSVFPFIMICVLPIIGLAGAFALGRWSALHTISVQPRDPQAQAAASPFYQNYKQEE